ncbi:glycosyl hydrolase family 8 [Hamadaea sp. NPDC050747]|uniref:glycosyl hydrolase family 8 n=1 Tax=Hamadaea sp. NPDC050747 TaxID=3155789 RepID=UPI0034055CD2
MKRYARGLALTAGLALVAALSPASPGAAAATRYEAESATVSQGVVEANHLNYSGTGFVNGDNVAGSYTEWTVNAANAGPATLTIRYSNGTTTGRPADIAVNGTVIAAASAFGSTTNWDTWANKTVTATLTAGTNKVRVTATTANGPANLDYLDVDSTATATDYQAENAVLSQAAVATNHTGYTGTGFVDYTNVSGSYVEWTVNAAAAGSQTLTFRYANGTTVDRPMDIAVNGTVVAAGASFPATANWDTWTTKAVTASLVAGTNTIRATATTANGGPNVDLLSVTGGGGGGDTQAPTVPGNLRSTGVTSSSVSLAWDASTDNVGVTGYDVYRGGALATTVTGTTATVGGLAAATAYTFTVKAHDAAGNSSAASNSVTATTSGSTGGPAVPFGSHLFAYAAGMLKPSGSQSTLDQAVVTLYTKWKANFVKQNCGNGWYETISPDADHPYVAEGQGYGMVITATMAGADANAKTIFDGMVKYVLAHPSVNNGDLLAAEQDTSCTSVNGSDSATDGDMDVAYALLLADKQWGSAGTYNYKQLAIKRINAIKASEINPTTNLLKLGDWSSCCDALYYTTRPSDHMIDHMRAFRVATGDSAWDTIRSAHQTLITNLQAQYAPSTGLLPDFVITTNTTPKPPTGEVLEGPNDGKYYWNSCRTPWRLGADAVTSGNSASLTSARKLNTWIKSKTGGNPASIVDGYSLSGANLDSGNDACFYAPFAVAAMTDSGSQAWLDALWNHMVTRSFGSTEYYNMSVQLQVMIVVSGNYWVP